MKNYKAFYGKFIEYEFYVQGLTKKLLFKKKYELQKKSKNCYYLL